MSTQSKTHFCNAELTIELWEELYGPALKLQREKYGLTRATRGMLLCDAFAGAHATSSGEHLRRQEWADRLNVALPDLMPGGWSAKGQPCDKVHNHWRAGCDIYLDRVLGYSGALFKRPRFEDLQLSSIGMVEKEVKPADLIKAAKWSWFDFMSPRLHEWAWVECGLVTPEQLAELHRVNIAAMDERIREANRLIHDLSFEGVPALQVPSLSELLQRTAVGDVEHVWQIFSDNEWVIMPHVLRRLMCRVLAKYNAGSAPLRAAVAAADGPDALVAAEAALANFAQSSVTPAVISGTTGEEAFGPFLHANVERVGDRWRLKPTRTGKARTGYIMLHVDPRAMTMQFNDETPLKMRALRIEHRGAGAVAEPGEVAVVLAALAADYPDEVMQEPAERLRNPQVLSHTVDVVCVRPLVHVYIYLCAVQHSFSVP